MKNLIYTAILCMPLIIIGQNEIQTESNFNGRHCRGKVGLCAIGSGDMAKNNVNSTLIYDAKKGLVLNIKMDNLTDEELSKAFGKVVNRKNNNEELLLIVEEDFELDQSLLKTLKVPKERVIIKSGNYASIRKVNSVTVLFKLY